MVETKPPLPQRREVRVATELPVSVAGGAAGTTKNISASGVFFVTGADFAPGNVVSFSIELQSRGEVMVLECSGEVVRVEHGAGMTGVAARILESRLERKTDVENRGAQPLVDA